MADDSTNQLQGLIDRMNAGDRSARNELITRAYDRLKGLAHRMLQGFARVRSFEQTTEVLNDAMPRFFRTLEAAPPTSVAHFFRLAARQIRFELIDLAKHYYGPAGPGGKHVPPPAKDGSASTSPPAEEKSDTTHEPGRLAAWTEFHEQVEKLPEEERDVFDLLWYQELTQAEAAAVLEVAEITVRRRWLAARRRLGAILRKAQGE
jgi:RNA polymerase sigma factor (sigma-70 family)